MNTPNVTASDTIQNRFWSKVAITADDNQCWLWTACVNNKGYGKLTIRRRSVIAHRFAWAYPDYVIPDGMEILHSCDNPRCCNPKHLFLGTQHDNMADMTAKGRRAYGNKVSSPGEKNPNSKLTLKQVEEIRNRYAQGGITCKELAKEYGVGKSMISYINTKANWK